MLGGIENESPVLLVHTVEPYILSDFLGMAIISLEQFISFIV